MNHNIPNLPNNIQNFLPESMNYLMDINNSIKALKDINAMYNMARLEQIRNNSISPMKSPLNLAQPTPRQTNDIYRQMKTQNFDLLNFNNNLSEEEKKNTILSFYNLNTNMMPDLIKKANTLHSLRSLNEHYDPYKTITSCSINSNHKEPLNVLNNLQTAASNSLSFSPANNGTTIHSCAYDINNLDLANNIALANYLNNNNCNNNFGSINLKKLYNEEMRSPINNVNLDLSVNNKQGKDNSDAQNSVVNSNLKTLNSKTKRNNNKNKKHIDSEKCEQNISNNLLLTFNNRYKQ